MSPSEIAAEIARLEGILVEAESGARARKIRMGEREIENSEVDKIALRRRIDELKGLLSGGPRRARRRLVVF
jgi:hypothetical protein